MADLQLRIRSDSDAAKRDIQTLRREMAQLSQGLGQSQRSADAAGNEVEEMGRKSRQASGAVDTLGDESQQSATQIGRMGDASQRTSRETQTFTRSLGSLGSVLGGIGIAVVGASVNVPITPCYHYRCITAVAGFPRVACSVFLNISTATSQV